MHRIHLLLCCALLAGCGGSGPEQPVQTTDAAVAAPTPVPTPTPTPRPAFSQLAAPTPEPASTYNQPVGRDVNDPRAVTLSGETTIRLGQPARTLRAEGEGLEGVRAFLRSGDTILEMNTAPGGAEILFDENQTIEGIPAGQYDFVVLRKSGDQTILEKVVTITE